MSTVEQQEMIDIQNAEVMSQTDDSSKNKPSKLIIHCGYHKVATTTFRKILKKIAQQFNWEFQSCKQDELKMGTDVFIQNHSQIDLSRLPPHVGSHIIRDPRDLVISGYFYHQWCTEKWCNQKRKIYEGRSYQEVLNSLSKEEGIVFEMERSRSAIENMANWNYSNPNFIEIRLEELSANQIEVFTRIFHKFELNEVQMEQALSVVEKLTFEKLSGRKPGEENRKSHFRKGVPGDWKNHFTEEHKKTFKQMYPSVLVKLGYEQNEDW